MSDEEYPLVSILIVCYQQAEFLDETIQGALNQDYPNIEIVISDDSSKDNTASILNEYDKKYPGKFRICITENNLGVTGNCNFGLAACRGKYIAIQGGDDVFLPGKISAQVNWLEQDEQRVLSYHDMDVFDSDTGKSLWQWSKRFKTREGGVGVVVKHGTFMCGSSLMIKRPSCSSVTFDSRVSVSSDWLFWIDCLGHSGGSIGYLDKVYARYRRHDRNVTSSGDHDFSESLVTLDIVEQSYAQLIPESRYRRAIVYLTEAKRHLMNKNLAKFLHNIKRSIMISPVGALSGIKISILRIAGKRV